MIPWMIHGHCNRVLVDLNEWRLLHLYIIIKVISVQELITELL